MSSSAVQLKQPVVVDPHISCQNTSCRAIWAGLSEDSICTVFIVDTSGHFLFANKAFADLVGAASTQSVVGTDLEEWFERQFVSERLTLLRESAATGAVIKGLEMIRSRRFTMTVRPLADGQYAGALLVILSPRPLRPAEVAAAVQLRHQDAGPLAELTPRELDVLRLLAQGSSQREVADKLGRTVKTIEAHRAALGRKLDLKKNVQLALFAIEAGLLDQVSAPGP